MKATLEFNLPEDSDDHYTAINAAKYRLALYELDNWLRSKLKYEELSGEALAIYEEVRQYLRTASDGLEL